MLLGIITDIHEDVVRLQQAITLLKNQGCDKLVCLGDIVGYSVPYYGYLASKNGGEVIKLVKEHCDIVVSGNHDLYACKKIPEFLGDFVYPQNWYSLDYYTRKELADEKVWLYENNELPALLSKQDEEYLRNLPEYHVESFGDVNILFSHFFYPDLTGSTTRKAEDIDELHPHFDFMKKHNCSISIIGHEHQLLGFTTGKYENFEFNKKYGYNEDPYGFIVPAVANGTFPNGVAIFDTDTKEIIELPLGTPVHPKQDWRKL